MGCLSSTPAAIDGNNKNDPLNDINEFESKHDKHAEETLSIDIDDIYESKHDKHVEETAPFKPLTSMGKALAQLTQTRASCIPDDSAREERKKSYAILIDVYFNQIKRSCKSFLRWDVPREVVAICISYCEALDGPLIMRPNAFVQLNANYEYVYEEIAIGESSTLSARQNDKNKAKMTIFCFGDITLHPYSYVHLNETLKLSSYVGYAIYIESFGNIVMMNHSHIDIDSDNASIFIKCKKLIMKHGTTIKATNGQKIVLVISDDQNRTAMQAECSQPGSTYINPRPEIHADSPSQQLGNIKDIECVTMEQQEGDDDSDHDVVDGMITAGEPQMDDDDGASNDDDDLVVTGMTLGGDLAP